MIPVDLPAPPVLPVILETETKRRGAVAMVREGAIVVSVPQQWHRQDQQAIGQQLAQRVQAKWHRDWLLAHQAPGPRISLSSPEALKQWAMALNATTLAVPVQHVRIGDARYTRLAQMNLKTRGMTVSHYCLQEVPVRALEYLVVHELAHLLVPNHSKAFWSYVARYISDYRQQRRVIAAVHQVRLFETHTRHIAPTSPGPLLETPDIQQQLLPV